MTRARQERRREVSMPWRIGVLVGAAAAFVSVTTSDFGSADIQATAAEQIAPEQAAAAQESIEAGFFGLSGGPVRAKLARTQTTLSALSEGAWRPLPGAVLTRIVPAGTTDLFNVAFSAECQVRSLGNGDTARIRIAHFINGVQTTPVEPYDGDQRFCSAVNPLATHKGNWAKRVGPGSHTLRVEIMPVDFVPDNGVLVATIDDWTFELVVYD
ncbi:MAG TPA: hypothetical protein VHJ58_10895 [Vicinamibacterales bacterium]|nr:hypothetical protein [Vicinamibacterales bacterium]